jgi:hypothetical protein
MALINTLKTDTFDAWRIKTNTTASELGDNALLIANSTLTTTNAVDAILEVLIKSETEIGVIGALTTTAQTLVGGINEHDAEIGVLSTLTTAQKGTIVGSINELDLDIGAPSALTTTAKNNIVSAINELDAEHGVLSTLTTTAKGTLVSSINEIVARESSRYANTFKLDLTHSSVGGSNNSTQNILSNMSMPSGKTFTIDGTLDISDGNLVVGGTNGTLNINTTFLRLGDVNSLDAPSGGIIINRGTDGSNERTDVRVYWDKTDNKWHLKRLDAGGSAITPYILDDINFSDIITSGSQAGIAVTYDQATNKLDFDVNDFAITLTGDVSGTATVTNLGNVSIATTVQPNRVALGTDTTGAYVQTINLDSTKPGISFSAAAGTGGESTDITALKVDNTVVRTFGAQSVAGIKTFDDKPIFSSGITTNAISTLHSAIVTSNLTIQGNLTVSGTTTTVNSEEVTIADNIIVLNSNAAAIPTENAGFEVERGSLTNSSVLWDEAADDWKMYNGTASYYLAGKLVAGNSGVFVSQDSTEKAQWSVSHTDTSSQVSIDNSNGTVIQDITLDTYGHVTALGSYDLDNRYFTETEADARFVNVTGDTMTGELTNSSGFVGPLTGNASTASSAAKLTTARTIKLEGDATGSVSFDGSSNATITVAVVDDSHNHVISNIDNFTEEVQDVVGGMFDGTLLPDENGVSIYYDDATGKIRADVNDFTITLSGAISGTGTVNNLGNVAISTSGNASDLNTLIDDRMPRIYNVSGTQVFPVL